MPQGSAALNLAEAARRVRELLKGGAQVDFTRHALEEMADDKLTVAEVFDALTHCRVIRPPQHDITYGNWKYTTEGRSENKRIDAVVVIDTEPEGLTIITVWEVRGR